MHNYTTSRSTIHRASAHTVRNSPDRIKKLLEITLACSLTYKQEELLLSFQDQFNERGSLSDKQLTILEDIYERANP